MKKILILFFTAVLIAVSVSASFAAKKRVLNVDSRLWSKPNEQEFIINEIFRPFEIAHNVVINYHNLNDELLFQRAKVAKATNRAATDVIIAHASWFKAWVDSNSVQDLTPLVSSWNDRTFSKGFKTLSVFNGKQYFLPIGGDVYLLAVNKKALKYLPSGVDVQNISWEQLADWSNAVADGEGEGKFGWTGVPQKSLIYQYGGVSLSYGAKFPEMDSPGAVAAWKVISKMARGFSPSIRSYDNVTPPLKRGEIWLTTAHNARVGAAYEANPTQFVIAPVPSGPAGNGTIGGTSGFAIPVGAPNQELAVEFLEYMTRPDIMAKASIGSGFIPTIDEAVEYLGDSSQDEIVTKALDVLKNGVVSFIDSSPYTGWGEVKLVFDNVFDKMVLTDKKYSTSRLQEGVSAFQAVHK